MTDFVSEWAAAGLTEVTLPSGRMVRLRLPEPRDLIVRGLLPTSLIEAVMADPTKDWSQVAEANPELNDQMAASLAALAADSIRQGRRTEMDEWEAVTVPPATYAKLPDADRELIEAKVLSNLPDEAVDATPEEERRSREEAGATVDGYREFRGERPRTARGKGRRAVEHPAVEPDRPAAADRGAGARPGARRAARKG